MKEVSKYIDHVENTILVWTILGLAFLGFVQVITRYLLEYSFTWYEELGPYLGVFITFFGASIAVKSSNHFVMDFFVRKLKGRKQQLLCGFAAFVSAVFCFLVVWSSWKMVARSFDYGNTSAAMHIPTYIAYLPIPFFSLIMGMRFIVRGFSLWFLPYLLEDKKTK